MRISCGPTWKEKIKAKTEWHRWWAWRPVRLGDSHNCRWLEWVDRRGTFYNNDIGSCWDYEYRARSDPAFRGQS
jgi:hypothetical protein